MNRRALIVIAAAAALALPAAAGATAPSLGAVSDDSGGYVQVSLYVYSPRDPYVIEIGSAPNQVDAFGAFVPAVTVARAGDLRAPSSGNTLIWRSSGPLVAGTYYIHAAQDRTASYIQFQVRGLAGWTEPRQRPGRERQARLLLPRGLLG